MTIYKINEKITKPKKVYFNHLQLKLTPLPTNYLQHHIKQIYRYDDAESNYTEENQNQSLSTVSILPVIEQDNLTVLYIVPNFSIFFFSSSVFSLASLV